MAGAEKRYIKNLKCWIITEGIAGTENQCLGVAQALGVTPEVKRVALNFPWNVLSPYLALETSGTFSPPLKAPWPDLLIASGRKSIAASRYIKRVSGGHCLTVQIQDPRVPADQFDLVAVPAHDPTRGDHVVVTVAAPNKITAQALTDAKLAFPELGALSGPRVAVLIGGNSKAYTMSGDVTRSLAGTLSTVQGSLMVTCSRRTGIENHRILQTALDKPGNFFWDGQGENPYLAMLGWADVILVTADSVSMLSESCTTGKPVYMIELEGGSPRISKLHENLMARGALRPWKGSIESWTYEPLNDAQMVANAIKTRFSLV
ncbi:MAG: mitochondrial fission ELM1 family protein [Alphaproteobacteria bacterium]|nr:mitochondrial fission ELM1 family protein [Alphaproteobacteria bacterium]